MNKLNVLGQKHGVPVYTYLVFSTLTASQWDLCANLVETYTVIFLRDEHRGFTIWMNNNNAMLLGVCKYGCTLRLYKTHKGKMENI